MNPRVKGQRPVRPPKVETAKATEQTIEVKKVATLKSETGFKSAEVKAALVASASEGTHLPSGAGVFNVSDRVELFSTRSLRVASDQVPVLQDKLEALLDDPSKAAAVFGEGASLRRVDRSFIKGPDGQVARDANGRAKGFELTEEYFDFPSNGALRERSTSAVKFNFDLKPKPGFEPVARVELPLELHSKGGIGDLEKLLGDDPRGAAHLAPTGAITTHRYAYVLDGPKGGASLDIDLQHVARPGNGAGIRYGNIELDGPPELLTKMAAYLGV